MSESPIPKPTSLDNGGGESLKAFQLTTAGVKEKSSKEWGIAIAKYIYTTCTTGLGGYYFNRNARYRKNRNYANGRLDIQSMFQDRFQFNGKQNFIALNWQTLLIVNRIISALVGRWMGRNEKIQVTAIDSLSQTEKQEEYDKAEFILYNREMIENLQQESGIPLLSQNQFIPSDKEELNLWQAQFQRLPEEILYELGCNDVLSSNGWFDVLKEKMLHDSAEVGFVGTYTWMDKEGVIHVKWVKPEDAIYSFSEYPDFRDTTWRGEMPSMKISELRKKYGKEFGGTLTEEQLWDIAQKCKEFQYYTNLTWTDTWYTAYLRPYDEWNLRSMHFELKTVDNEPYTVTKTKTSGSTYTKKGYPTTQGGNKREKPLNNQTVLEDTSWNIYTGVYLPEVDILLEWKLKDNMIRPQDPKEIGNAEFSYSFYMYQNYQMRNLAVPEKIEAAVDGMILALLKMQQLVARMRPTGAAIDESALQNIDYGLGDASNRDIDYKKLFDQTGDIYYRGVDAEGNRVPIPIQELANSGFLGQMNGLIQNYQFNYQILKDELGEDPNLISQALQPRVAAGNVEVSQQQAEFATDYMYRAYTNCMADTARKISCLLKDSVKYGTKTYKNLIKAEDVGDRIFTTKIHLLPTQLEFQRFDALMNQALAASPDLVMFVDPFNLTRVAKEDVKLAELLFRQGQKKMLLYNMQMQQQNQQMTFQAQQQSAIVAEEEKRKTAQQQGEVDMIKSKMLGDSQNKSTVLSMVSSLLQKQQETGASIPNEIQPLIQAVIENVMVSTIAATDEQKEQIIAKMQQAQMEQQAMAEQQAAMGGQGGQEEMMQQEGQPIEQQNIMGGQEKMQEQPQMQ